MTVAGFVSGIRPGMTPRRAPYLSAYVSRAGRVQCFDRTVFQALQAAAAGRRVTVVSLCRPLGGRWWRVVAVEGRDG